MNNTREIADVIKKIKLHRDKMKLSYQDLSDKTGISKSTLQRYETGEIKNIKINNLTKIANALNVTPGYLMGLEDLSEELHTLPIQKNNLTIYGSICAGDGKLAYEDLITEITNPYQHVSGEIIGLQVDGESMNKVVHNGDYAILKMQPTVENGQIAAIIIDGEDAMLKRFYRVDEETVMLKPESTEPYEPLVFVGEQINKLRIIAKYIGHVSPCEE